MPDYNLNCPNCFQVNVVTATPGDTVHWTCGNLACGESFYTVLSPLAPTDPSDTETDFATEVTPDDPAAAADASSLPVDAADVTVANDRDEKAGD